MIIMRIKRMKKYLVLVFENGETWRIDAEAIAENRAKYYHELEKDENPNTYQEEFDYTMSNEVEIKDWAFNNMDWDDFTECRELIETANDFDYQGAWMNLEDSSHVEEMDGK